MNAAAPQPPPRFELSVTTATENLKLIRDFIADAVSHWALSRAELRKVQLAVDEACTNVMEHSCCGDPGQLLRLAVLEDDDCIVITIEDPGRALDPSTICIPDLEQHLAARRVSGLGLYLLKTLMDEVEWRRDGETNIVRLSKRLPDRAQPEQG